MSDNATRQHYQVATGGQKPVALKKGGPVKGKTPPPPFKKGKK